MDLSRFPRRRYTPQRTAIEFLPNLSRELAGPRIWIKRDDTLGLAAGGNKTRKLEFLVADALAQGADTLITIGAVQSNHCRLTLAAAAKEGLKCRLVLEERVAGSYDPAASGNNFLYQLMGAERISVVPAGTDPDAAMAALAEDLPAQNRRAYVIPGGGSNPRRTRLRRLRQRNPRPGLRGRPRLRSHRLRQRQLWHAFGPAGRPGGPLSAYPAHRDQRPPAARGTGGQCP